MWVYSIHHLFYSSRIFPGVLSCWLADLGCAASPRTLSPASSSQKSETSPWSAIMQVVNYLRYKPGTRGQAKNRIQSIMRTDGLVRMWTERVDI